MRGRPSLSLKEGYYLDAEVVAGVLRLKPISVVDRAAALRQVREAQATVRYRTLSHARPQRRKSSRSTTS